MGKRADIQKAVIIILIIFVFAAIVLSFVSDYNSGPKLGPHSSGDDLTDIIEAYCTEETIQETCSAFFYCCNNQFCQDCCEFWGECEEEGPCVCSATCSAYSIALWMQNCDGPVPTYQYCSSISHLCGDIRRA
jgi:hypothetical protein